METTNDGRTSISKREQNYKCNSKDVNPGLGLSSGEGTADGNKKQNQIFNSDSSWRNSVGEESIATGQRTDGKILRQLRELQYTHLAFVDKHKQSLESQINATQEYSSEIIKNIENLEKQIVDYLSENNIE